MYTKSQVGYILPIWGGDPFEPISTKIDTLVRVHWIMTLLVNSAAATAQPVVDLFID